MRFPVFREKRNTRFISCACLSPVIFIVLSLISYLFLLFGISGLNPNPNSLMFVSIIPGAIILFDNKAGVLEFLAYLVVGWFLTFLAGVLLLVLIWSLAGGAA